MSTRKTGVGSLRSLVVALNMLAPLALAPSAFGSNAGPEYEVLLLASHPDWMKRHPLTRQPVTPYNPNESLRDGEVSARHPCHPDPGKCRGA